MLAGVALEELAGAEPAVAAGAAGGADEAVGPASLQDGLGAHLLAAVALQERRQGEAFLELDLVAFHLITP